MRPRLRDLSTELAGARAVVVDDVVQGGVVPRQLLLLGDDQRAVYIWGKSKDHKAEIVSPKRPEGEEILTEIGSRKRIIFRAGAPESKRESWISTLSGPAPRRGSSCSRPGSSLTWGERVKV